VDIITSDAETYWAQDYSLSCMSPLEYVLSPHFELICLSLKVNDEATRVHFGTTAIQRALAEIDFSRAMLLGHNMSGFDSYIFSYRLGIRPRMWGCTLAMARPLHAKTVGVGLGKLVEHYGLGQKDNRILMSTKGKRLSDFTPAELDAMARYNRDDTDQCRQLFDIMRPQFAAAELWQIDALTRMRTEPQFELDTPLLETALSIERSQKQRALLRLATMLSNNGTEGEWDVFASDAETVEYVRSKLSSQPQFAALLQQLGVEVPMKPSTTVEGKMIPALAKSDPEFLALQEHEDEVVAAAARARLSVKSTLLETRIEKVTTAARMTGGRLPIPLKYAGADTTGRDSGEEYNPQNFPRIDEKNPKTSDALRRSLKAPEGYVVMVADQSGIELRVNHFLWQVESSMSLFRADPGGADLYKDFAGRRLYKIAPEKVTKPQRQIGKIAHLGLGFGAGPATFVRVAKTMGGVDIPLRNEIPQDWVDEVGNIKPEFLDQYHALPLDGETIVREWRDMYAPIVKGWRTCHDALPKIKRGERAPIDPWGMCKTHPEGIELPSGRLIRYPDLHQESVKVINADGYEWVRQEWWYGRGRHRARIYAGKVDENAVQALARDSLFEKAIEFFRWSVDAGVMNVYNRVGLRPALRVHDELVYIVRESEAKMLLEKLQSFLRTPPRWWPELIVWSEGDIALSYGDAK
jgi:DNA polymerase bacteriophage-type